MNSQLILTLNNISFSYDRIRAKFLEQAWPATKKQISIQTIDQLRGFPPEDQFALQSSAHWGGTAHDQLLADSTRDIII